MHSWMRNRCHAWLIAGPALLAMLTLAACTHIEPQHVHGKQAWIGDKVWNFCHPWYDPKWDLGFKILYWAGPGH